MGDGSGWVTEAEMIEVDRVMVEDLGIDLVQMMENAGRNLAQFAIDRYAPSLVVVCAGSGGNGGGGMVAARHLANRGVEVNVVLSRPRDDFVGVAARQLGILEKIGVEVFSAGGDTAGPCDLLIDALIGYSLRGAPRARSLELIEAMNSADPPVLALDMPSGIDATTGETPGVSVRTDATLTLAAPKTGLRTTAGVGDLFVADISVPPVVFTALGHPAPDFSSASIVAVPGSR
jgi:NAD(P)H-hydrate epimerase